MDPKTKTGIHRIGRTLNLICVIARAAFCVMTLLSAIGAFVALARPEILMRYEGWLEQNTLFLMLRSAADLESMEPRYVGAIGCAVSAITFGTLTLYTRGFQTLLLALIENERPFSFETARKIRQKSYLILLTVLYNPVIGPVLFLLALLFSYLVEYGAYLQEKADETNRIQGEMIVSFAEITENKSGQTGNHVRRVAEYSRVIAEELGMPEDQANNLGLASTMHDIGKLMIPSEILEKPGKLTDEEYRTIKQHTTYGGELLKNVEGDIMQLGRTVALEHHERPDGKGYPEGKRDISLEGRIVAVADVYDALTSRRSYKDAWDEEQAFQEIVRCKGTQFDPDVVDAFVRGHERINTIREQFRDPNSAA